MKKIPVKSLRAGSIFTEAVYIEGNNLLVPPGIAIRKKDIDHLEAWGIETVSTDGELAHEVPEKPPAPQASPPEPLESPEERGSYRSYTDLILELKNFFDALVLGNAPDVSSVDRSTRGIVRMVQEDPKGFLGYVLRGEAGDYDLAKSAVHTGVLSYLIAAELQFPVFRLFQLVTAALFHDVGMLRLPQGIMKKTGSLTPEEMNLIKTHPLHSYRIVHKELLYPEDVGRIVLQHHERWDGKGYPQGLAETAIDLGARVLSVADAFEAMISAKPYRNSMIGAQAMRNILAGNAKQFDPGLLKVFIKIMGIYPVGSRVLLNNGAFARVLEAGQNAPLRPRIVLLSGGSGQASDEKEGKTIDLLKNQELFILRALESEEVSKGYA